MSEVGSDKQLKLIDVKNDIISELIVHCDKEYIAALKLTQKQVDDLVKYIIEAKSGDHYSIPLICAGEECVYKNSCPLLKANQPPCGLRCPIENITLNMWKNDYVNDLGVNWNDKIERGMVMDLVEADLLNARANEVLSNKEMIVDVTVGVDPATGGELTRPEENVAFSIKDRMKNRRDKILKQFIATREAKLKFTADKPMDMSQYLSNLRNAALKNRILEANTTTTTSCEDVVLNSGIVPPNF